MEVRRFNVVVCYWYRYSRVYQCSLKDNYCMMSAYSFVTCGDILLAIERDCILIAKIGPRYTMSYSKVSQWSNNWPAKFHNIHREMKRQMLTNCMLSLFSVVVVLVLVLLVICRCKFDQGHYRKQSISIHTGLKNIYFIPNSSIYSIYGCNQIWSRLMIYQIMPDNRWAPSADVYKGIQLHRAMCFFRNWIVFFFQFNLTGEC